VPHTILGVDLGAHSLKVAELSTGFRQLSLVAFHERELPQDGGTYLDRAAAALRDLIRDKGLLDSTVYAAMPGDQLSLRLLALPFSDAKKIEQVIGFELESQILAPIEEVVHEHKVVASAATGSKVLAAAARKDDVRTQLSRLAETGIESRELFAAPLVYDALADRFLSEQQGAIAVVDVGAEHTNVCVLREGKLLMARTISHGGGHVTRALSKTFRLPEPDAERAKPQEAFAPHSGMGPLSPAQSRMGDAVRTSLMPLVRELRQTFALVRAETGEAVLKVLVCGGGSRLLGLPEYLMEELEVVCEPLVLGAAEGFEEMPEDTTVMPQALAIALAGATGRREIDFRRGEFAYKADFSFLRAKASYLAACVLAVLATAAFDAYAALHQLRRDEASLDQRLKTESAELFGETVGDPELVSKRIKQGIKMDELPVPAETAYDLLDDISRAMPDPTKVKLDVTELDIKNKKTFIKGTTDSSSAVDDIANFLSKIKCFESEKNDSVVKGPIQNVPGQQELKQFTLTIASKCP
jgi:general secretion pathway protein L